MVRGRAGWEWVWLYWCALFGTFGQNKRSKLGLLDKRNDPKKAT